MALKPTIYKFNVALSDLNRDVYETLNLTLAQHPSETKERMLTRMLVYCLNAQPNLTFAKSLSDTDEPDLWVQALNGDIQVWIDVGEPSRERIKKASHQAAKVLIYSFNTKSNRWWQTLDGAVNGLPVSVFRLAWEPLVTLANICERSQKLSVTISENSAYVATGLGECQLSWQPLQSCE